MAVTMNWNYPLAGNPILTDLQQLQAMLNACIQLTPAGENIPTGALKLASVSGGVQLQKYNGSAFANVGKLIHNVDQLDGYHASTSATASTIPVYNSSAKLVGSITGNAEKANQLVTARSIDIGGIVTATAQSFNGTANITIPVTQITINNNDDTAINGILSVAHGGTGNSNGSVTDVIVSGNAGNSLSAKAYGQIGQAVTIGNTDLNSLTTDGFYIDTTRAYHTIANHYPLGNVTNVALLVRSSGTQVCQILKYGTNSSWYRISSDSGSTWDSWASHGSTYVNNVIIYLSKSGSDDNTGLDASSPVLTVNRAFNIAQGLLPSLSNAVVILRFGAGNWGNVTISKKPYVIYIQPFDGANATAYSEDLPVFGTLAINMSSVQIYSVVASVINAHGGSYCYISSGVSRVGRIVSRYGADVHIEGTTSNALEISGGSVNSVFCVYQNGTFTFTSTRLITVVESLTISTGFVEIENAGRLSRAESAQISLGTDVTVTGCRAKVGADCSLGGAVTDTTFPGTVDVSYENGSCINGIVQDDSLVHLAGEETITGLKSFANDIIIQATDDSGFKDLYFAPTSGNKQAAIRVYGVNNELPRLEMGIKSADGTYWYNGPMIKLYNGGTFEIVANNNTTNASLIGTADKTLSWNGRLVLNYAAAAGDAAQNGMLLTGTKSNFAISISNTSVTKGTAPTASQYWGINFYGADTSNYKNRIGMIETCLTTANLSTTAIRAYNCTSNTNSANCTISCNVDANGNIYTTAPTPSATTDNTTKIATTAWVRTATGTFACNASTATQLATARNFQTNLASTSEASFDGTAACSPGVTGTLPIANGGTGLTASPSMLVNLGSTTAANVLAASPRPGITGTLPIANGGTGLTASPSLLVNLASTTAANVMAASPRPGITGTLAVAHGGTGQTAVINNTSIGNLDWSSSIGERVVTGNTIAYWNGCYSGTTSNLAYCNKGAFGDMATKTASAYCTLATAQTLSGVKTFSNKTIISGDHSTIGTGLILNGGAQNYALAIQNTSITKGDTTSQSSANYSAIEFYGTAMSTYKNRLASLSYKMESNVSMLRLIAYDCTAASTTSYASVDVYVDSGGTKFIDLNGVTYFQDDAYLGGKAIEATNSNGGFLVTNGNEKCSLLRGGSYLGLYDGTNSQWIVRRAANKSYIHYGTVSSVSDERHKKDIADVQDKLLDAWEDVSWVQFRYRDEINDKLNVGIVAQRVESVFNEHGLTASDYPFFEHDVWQQDEEHKTAGDQYFIHYTDALSLEAAYMRRKTARLEARIAELEKLIAA